MDETNFRSSAHEMFGSLEPLSSSSSIDIPLRYGVEKRESKDGFDDRDEILVSFSLHDYLDKHRKIQETNYETAEDVWNEVEALIGLDSTLDNEEEEDEYDRMSQGLTISFQNAYNLRINHIAPEIRPNEDPDEAYKDEESLFHVIKDDFLFKSTSEGNEDADADADISTKIVPFNLACSHDFKTASSEDQYLKSILKRKTNGNNHGGTESPRQVSCDDLACSKDFPGASKESKDMRNAGVKSGRHVTFDLACKDHDERAAKKHQGLKSTAEGNIRMKKMQRLPKLNPESLSALAQLARLISEVQGKGGSLYLG